MKKILFYYWDPIDGPAGGGVTAYLKELFSLLIKSRKYELFYINSGRRYDDSGKIYINENHNIFNNAIRSFEIVNCPVLAPAKQSVKNVRFYLECKEITPLLAELIDNIGGIDIIHFHSLEGLPLKVLEIKDVYPNIKLLYTFHNYFPLCTQVNMWKNDAKCCNLSDFNSCISCYAYENYDMSIYRFKHLDVPGLKQKNLEKAAEYPDVDDESLYREFNEMNRQYFNKYMDTMLAVSERTKKIYALNGYDADKMITSYVGTEVADRKSSHVLKLDKRDQLRIIYMGYARKDKGFYFFLDALESMDEFLCKKLEVTLVSRGIDEKSLTRIKMVEHRVKDLHVYNGYKDYDELKNIMKDQDLGIVPVLWEDNLPRVAIEQIAMDVPILSSSLGGASELFYDNSDFVFEAGNISSFESKLMKIVNNRNLLESFWYTVKPLVTMEKHAEELQSIYREEYR